MAPRTRKPKEVVVHKLPVLPGTTKDGQMETLYSQYFGCKRCPLSQFRQDDFGNPYDDVVFGQGSTSAQVVIVGEAPGEEEEKRGIPFVGASGKILNQLLAMTSDDPYIQELSAWYAKASKSKEVDAFFHDKVLEWRQEAFFITNAVACRPPENRTPTPPELKACNERLWEIIYTIDPLLVIAAGSTALNAVLGKKAGVTEYRGRLLDATHEGRVGRVTYPVMPIFHPSYLMRTADWKEPDGDWAKTVEDMGRAMKILDGLRTKHFGTPAPRRMVAP